MKERSFLQVSMWREYAFNVRPENRKYILMTGMKRAGVKTYESMRIEPKNYWRKWSLYSFSTFDAMIEKLMEILNKATAKRKKRTAVFYWDKGTRKRALL